MNMQDFLPWVYGGIAVLGLLVLLRYLARKIGGNCHFCGNRTMFWNELDDEAQRDILDYYKQIEKRTPKTSAIFVCPNCKHVYDDFSGEKMSLDGDNASFCKICTGWHVNYLGQFGQSLMAVDLKAFCEKNPAFVDKTECLSCGRRPFGVGDCIQCDTKFKVMGCRNCKTLYGWIPMMQKQFLYTVPLTSEKVIENSPIWMPL